MHKYTYLYEALGASKSQLNHCTKLRITKPYKMNYFGLLDEHVDEKL